jgi:hypothetical protein
MQKRGRGYNPYAMGLYLEQVEKIEKDVAKVKHSGDPKDLESLKKSIFRRFEMDFPPAKRVVKAIDKLLSKLQGASGQGGETRWLLDYMINSLEHTSTESEAVAELVGLGLDRELAADLVQTWYKEGLPSIGNPRVLQTKAEALIESILLGKH